MMSDAIFTKDTRVVSWHGRALTADPGTGRPLVECYVAGHKGAFILSSLSQSFSRQGRAPMLYRVIDADELPSLVEAFMKDYEVVAPVKRGDSYAFDVVDSFDQIELDYPSTVASLKKYYIPPRETLFKFDADTNEVLDYELNVKPRVLFGAHSCDINALACLKSVFEDNRYPDPYFEAHEQANMVVGVSCTPTEACFCHLLDSDEVRTNYDLFLQDLGDIYLVSIGSVEAANILESVCHLREATDEDRIAFRQATRKRQESFNPDIPDIQEIPMLMDAFHDDPFWTELGNRCLSCTACSAVCPTCYCFDIRDTLEPDGHKGRRERVWDACTSPQFALVAGGHNFRDDAPNRVRHRMYHKLNGFLSKNNRNLCVGCGRCVRACKADISPIEVLKFFERKGA